MVQRSSSDRHEFGLKREKSQEETGLSLGRSTSCEKFYTTNLHESSKITLVEKTTKESKRFSRLLCLFLDGMLIVYFPVFNLHAE